MKFYKKIYFITFLILFSGCAIREPKPDPSTEYEVYKPPVREPEIDPEIRQQVLRILETVQNLSQQGSLNYLGQNTMNEAVMIMDMGKKTSPVLGRELRKNFNWKYRYWLVDILGYIEDRNNIIPLIEIIENENENLKVRLRACESLQELGFKESAEQLKISRNIVENEKVKTKIDETISSIR